MARNRARTNVGPLERGLSVAAGAVLGTMALRRRSPASALLSGGAAYLLYRGVSGRCLVYRQLGVTGSEVGETVSAHSQITLQRPAHEVYAFLEDLSNLPRFSKRIERAERVDDDRWRLTARTPLAGRLDWEVQRTEGEPGRRLAWCSVEGAPLPGAAEVRLHESDAGTELFVDSWFVPPRTALLAPALRRAERSRPLRRAGLTPSQLLHHELRRLRQLLDAGEITTIKGQPSGRVQNRSQREREQQESAFGPASPQANESNAARATRGSPARQGRVPEEGKR